MGRSPSTSRRDCNLTRQAAPAVAPAKRSEYAESTALTAVSEIVARRSLERARSRIDEFGESLDTERAVESLLEELAELFGAHRACITEMSEDMTTAKVTYEWCEAGIEPCRDRLGEIPSDAFPWLHNQLSAGDPVSIPSVADLPAEAAAERSELSRIGTNSMIVLPLSFGSHSSGMAGFEWSEPGPPFPLHPLAVSMVRGLLSAELHSRQAGIALQRTSRVLRAMIECSDALLRASDELALLEEVCRIIVEVGGYRLAWVGFGNRDAGRSVTPVAKWGLDQGYLDELQITWADIDRGSGPMSRAVRTGTPAAVQSVATDPDFERWREMALARGFRSVLAVSLHHGDELLGALGVYAGEAWAFDGVEMEMMQRFADYLSYGIVALRNLTEREKVEEQLRQALKSKDELVASISHELRTPLTAVVGFAQVLRESTDLGVEERAAMIRSIVDEGLDLSNIVEDLLTVARAEAGTLTVVQVPVDLRANAAQVFEGLREEDAMKITLKGPSCRVQADPGRVRQILRNLVSNALRYGGEKVVIQVVEDGNPRVQVLDNGPGIPPRDRERIFESYERAHETPGVTGSVGLGLAISRTLARLMGGDLTYRYRDGHSIFELSF
jgi:signal transduction histidine kinase